MSTGSLQRPGATARPSTPAADDLDPLAADLEDGAGPRPGHLSTAPVSRRALGLLLAIGGVVGFLAAFTLTVERFRLAEDPRYVPSCSINPVLSCGSVMATHQAALFGFPNPLLGIGAFAVSTTAGLLVLSRVELPRWMAAGLQVGVTAGIVLVGWLVSQSLYSIHALCPWCMVVWTVMVPTFWAVTADSLDRGVLPVPAGLRGAAAAVVEYRAVLVVATYAVLVVMIGAAFWSYWSSLV